MSVISKIQAESNEEELLREGYRIVEAADRLYKKDFLAACDGNISVRCSDGTILITPSGRQKAFLQPHEMAQCTVDGYPIRGKPSSETAMHLRIYQKCKQARVVVHAHPPHAISWSLARPDESELPVEKIPELLLALGSCPVVPYAIPGTESMADVLDQFLPDHRGFILKFHGALAWGGDFDEAVGGIERIEHAAKILSYVELLGGARSLPRGDLESLYSLRSSIHPRIL